MRSDALPLRTPSLVVRPFVPEDAPVLFALSREPSMREWIPSQVYRDGAHAASVLEYLIAQFEAPAHPARGAYVLGVEHRADGELIGHVGLSPFEGEVEIGYAIGERHQGRGFATEAIAAVTGWALATFALPRIVGITAVANIASQRTLARAGFTSAGARRMNFQGEEQEVRVFEMTAPRPGAPAA